MIYPIIAYGDPVLKKVAKEVSKEDGDLKVLIADMYETMKAAYGVGLAAPQIGKSIRLFIVDGSSLEEGNAKDFKQVFINPSIISEGEGTFVFEEGCLSIPGVRKEVTRPASIVVTYFDENWDFHQVELDGVKARIFQHEFDHLEGILFTDHLKTLQKQLLKSKLLNISKGYAAADYKMKFYNVNKQR